MALEVKIIENYPINSNCYLIFDKCVNNDCIIVDPGSQLPDKIDSMIQTFELNPKNIILTHEHFDHIWSCNYFIRKYGSKIICSSQCSNAINDAKKNLSLFYDQKGFCVPFADICIEDIGFQLQCLCGNISFFITEGHSNAGISFTIGHYLFTGDTLIKNVKTVTKLYSGSKEKLKIAILKINQFKGKNYITCPGHGESFELDTYNTEKAFKNI